MRIVAVLVMTLILTGCATPHDIRSKGAAFSVHSVKSARDVTACVSDKWENAPFFSKLTGTVNTNISKNGYSITAYGKNIFGMWPVLIAQIDEIGASCEISYFTTKPMADEKYYIDAIQECK